MRRLVYMLSRYGIVYGDLCVWWRCEMRRLVYMFSRYSIVYGDLCVWWRCV